jgi:hypothetical protein
MKSMPFNASLPMRVVARGLRPLRSSPDASARGFRGLAIRPARADVTGAAAARERRARARLRAPTATPWGRAGIGFVAAAPSGEAMRATALGPMGRAGRCSPLGGLKCGCAELPVYRCLRPRSPLGGPLRPRAGPRAGAPGGRGWQDIIRRATSIETLRCRAPSAVVRHRLSCAIGCRAPSASSAA